MATHEMTERERKIRDKRAALYQTHMVPVMEMLDRGDRLSVEDRKSFDDAETELRDLDADLDMVMKASKREAGRDEASETRGISRDENDSEENRYSHAFLEWFRCKNENMLKRKTLNILESGEHRAELDSASLQTVPGQGGYMIPQGFWANLQIALKQLRRNSSAV